MFDELLFCGAVIFPTPHRKTSYGENAEKVGLWVKSPQPLVFIQDILMWWLRAGSSCSECGLDPAATTLSNGRERSGANQMAMSHEEELAHKRQHHADHRDADNTRCLAYNAAHVKQIAEYKHRVRPLKHKGPKLLPIESRRLYRQAHLTELEAKNRLWWQSPKGRAYKKRRRHEARTLGKLDLTTFYMKCAELGWHCCICGKELTQETTTIDHIVPVKAGGTNDIENLQPLCGRCNCRKSTHSMKEMLGPEFLF